jgi:hypothetical protein
VRACFELDGEKICIDIPVLVRKWPWPDPDPDPPDWIDWIGREGEPNPSPWRDLTIVATISELTRYVRDEAVAATLRDAVANGVETVRRGLPKGLEIRDGAR